MTEPPSTEIIQAYNQNQTSWRESHKRGDMEIIRAATTSTRPEMTRTDYEKERTKEAINRGRTQNDLRLIIEECLRVHDQVGVIRNVMSLLASFAMDGVEIVHPDERTNLFYQNWSKKVKLTSRARQYASWLAKGGNVVVRREMATVSRENLRKILEVTDNEPANMAASSGKIPIKYWFYNPTMIEVQGDYLSCYANNKKFALRFSQSTLQQTFPKDKIEESVFNSLPQEVKDLFNRKVSKRTATGNTIYIPIPSDLIYVDHFDKDDSDIWAKPITYGVLQDVYYNEKVKLAKTAALDGMISPLRTFLLGDHTENLWPSPENGAALREILAKNTGGGPLDLIWTSDLKVETFYPPLSELSSYQEDYVSILVGLGIPRTLVGADKESSNSSSNVSLKGLISKIETIRESVKQWLEAEIDIIQAAMKFRRRPSVRFRHANLSDERVFFDILLELCDRNIISNERVLELFRDNHAIEAARVQREWTESQKESNVPKVGPYQPKREDLQPQTNQRFNGGRPAGAKDGNQRTRRNKDPISASMFITAENLYKEVYDYFLNLSLETNKKKDVRQLTASEKDQLDQAVDSIFSNCDPEMMGDTNIEKIILTASKPTTNRYKDFRETFIEFLKDVGPDVSLEQKRNLKTLAYCSVWGIN
jgi:hypothetical protein